MQPIIYSYSVIVKQAIAKLLSTIAAIWAKFKEKCICL